MEITNGDGLYKFSLGAGFNIFFGFLVFFVAPFGVRRGPEMIVSHRAPSSPNMSSYRAIWTHFRQNSMIFIDLILQLLAFGTCS